MTEDTAAEALSQLFVLQDFDAKITKLDQALAIYPQTRAANAERKRSAIAALDAATARLEEAELEHRRLEAKLGDADALHARLEGQSASVSSNQAYTAIMHEIEQAKTHASEAEDSILELLDTIDGQRSGVESDRIALAELEAEVEATELKMKQEEADHGTQRATALERRTALASDVEKELLRLYQVAANKHLDCIAKLSKKMCSGCRIAIPALQCQEIRVSGVPTTCPQCQRLLVGEALYERVSSEESARSSTGA